MTRLFSYPLAALVLSLGACASTTSVQLSPSPQAPVCAATARAQVFWQTAWRPDQKDVTAREAAAAEGLGRFFQTSGCFGSAALQRLPQQQAMAAIQSAVAEASSRHERVVVIVVRELGPTVRVGASLALLEGATEVLLDISEHTAAQLGPRAFTVHWRSGGPGVIKGVASLPQDMQAALVSGLQPAPR